MSGETVGAEEEPESLQLLWNCILTETCGGTDMLLVALGQSQTYCTPVTREPGGFSGFWKALCVGDLLSAS